jgi:ABC-type sugar transport system ATPase subunit
MLAVVSGPAPVVDVALQQVTKTYGRRRPIPAVSNLTLTAGGGAVLAIVGPSGCGKTTILRLIAGLEEVSAGTIRIGDRRVDHLPPKDRNVAMVFQHDALYPHMTAMGNIAFPLQMRGLSRDETRGRVLDLAGRLAIDHLLDRRPATLAGGERQRVALARAMVGEPQVLLLDEPSAHLDAALRMRLRTEIKDLHGAIRTTMIYVTHDQEEAMVVGDRVAVLRGGMLQQLAPPMEVYLRPATRFVAEFIGSPPMNTWPARLSGNAGDCWLESEFGRCFLGSTLSGCVASPSSSAVVAGLRPEDLCLTRSEDRNRQAGAGEFPFALDGRVYEVDSLGDRANVHVVLASEQRFVVRTGPDLAIAPGDVVRLTANPAKLHLFSADELGHRLN